MIMKSKRVRAGQRGATLLVSLIMLVVLTLFAVTMFNLSSVNLKIVGNFQQQRAVESVVQQAIEELITRTNFFVAAPAATNICVNGTGTDAATCAGSGGHWVAIAEPSCNYVTAASGYTLKVGELTPEDTNWEVRASYTDAATNASVALVQGIAVRLLAGNCPTS